MYVERKWSTVYLQNGKNLSIGNLLYITKNNPEAFAQIKKAQTCYTTSFLSGCAGGLCIVTSAGLASLGNNNPHWGVAFSGVALIGAAVYFERAFNKHAIRGVVLHNSALQPKTTHRYHMNFGLRPSGLGFGLTMR